MICSSFQADVFAVEVGMMVMVGHNVAIDMTGKKMKIYIWSNFCDYDMQYNCIKWNVIEVIVKNKKSL